MKNLTMTPSSLLKTPSTTIRQYPTSKTKRTEKKYDTLGAATNRNDDIAHNLQTYTAGEDSGRLAASAKEFGLTHQRQKRAQVRKVDVSTKEAGFKTRDAVTETLDDDKTSTVRDLNLKKPKFLTRKKLQNNDDTFDLGARFVDNQYFSFPTALKEIRHGSKRGCWLWFILPTSPYIVDGEERGSMMNRKYALRGDDCVKAYLKYEDKSSGVNLRRNYLAIARAIHVQLLKRKTLSHIFGFDDVKVISSLALFGRIAAEIRDEELAEVCRRVLELSKSIPLTNITRAKSLTWI